jgi:hypothetical protein
VGEIDESAKLNSEKWKVSLEVQIASLLNQGDIVLDLPVPEIFQTIAALIGLFGHSSKLRLKFSARAAFACGAVIRAH